MSKTTLAAQRIRQQLAFLLEIDKLKSVFRQTHLIHADRPENSAEHSWHLALLVLILSEYSNAPVDICRVLKMVLIHDLVEIDAGDTFCYDVHNALDKDERECQAADRLFQLLPDEQGRELRELWDEFEATGTPEAQFAGAVDRLMPLLHNFHTQGGSWRKHGITREQVLGRNAGDCKTDLRHFGR